jgi:predicted DCC family thiol-disulfide oxidoreductase YuxK
MHIIHDHPVLLFDGVCNLCNAAVRFIVRRDPRGRFRFASLQSDVAVRLLRIHGVMIENMPDSMVLIDEHRIFTRSAAALRIVRRLQLPWRVLYALIIIPRPLRDWAYDFIARRRYRWFGRRDQCMMPSPEIQSRFLTVNETSSHSGRGPG